MKPERTKCRIESYQSLLGVITHFCTCCFIFQLFLQL
nr:photosystem II protein L [Nothapodytes nimmoniana]WLG31465.1 photosystem II protein L [Nothapodytes nimmoniana]